MESSWDPEIEKRDGVTIFRLGPAYENLDDARLEKLRQVILGQVQIIMPPKAVIDLSHTKFFGSSFIEVLYQAWRRLTDRGGDFALSGLSPYCEEVIATTHLDRLWSVYPDSEAAVAALK